MHLIDGGIVANLAVEESIPDEKVIAVSVQIPVQEKICTSKNPIENNYKTLRKTVGIMILQNEMHSLQSRENAYLIRLDDMDTDY